MGGKGTWVTVQGAIIHRAIDREWNCHEGGLTRVELVGGNYPGGIVQEGIDLIPVKQLSQQTEYTINYVQA